MMKCPHAVEIRGKLLLPCYGALLQNFIDRWKVDPRFLVYHRESTTLMLRQELGSSFMSPDSLCRCHQVRLAECYMVDTLKEVMEERTIEQELEVV